MAINDLNDLWLYSRSGRCNSGLSEMEKSSVISVSEAPGRGGHTLELLTVIYMALCKEI